MKRIFTSDLAIIILIKQSSSSWFKQSWIQPAKKKAVSSQAATVKFKRKKIKEKQDSKNWDPWRRELNDTKWWYMTELKFSNYFGNDCKSIPKILEIFQLFWIWFITIIPNYFENFQDFWKWSFSNWFHLFCNFSNFFGNHFGSV